ncbi:MAG: SPFH domain-containing protein, partial [Polyangiaceae bacterium]
MATTPKSADVFVFKPPLRERVRFVGKLGILVAVMLAMMVVNAIGGSNAFTPAGHEGYVFQQPLAIGQREFVRTQRGPTSTGWAWRYGVTNLDMRITTYSEELKIFSSDNLEVTFEAHARIRLKGGSTKEVVERYSGTEWYANNVRRPYTTAVRETVRKVEAFTIKDQSLQIAHTVLERLRAEYKDTPIDFVSFTIGNISYPKSVEERVVQNLASEQRRQRMEVARQIAEAGASILEVRAKGEAEAQQIEQATLTPLFVQHEAAELYRDLAMEKDDVLSVPVQAAVIRRRSEPR